LFFNVSFTMKVNWQRVECSVRSNRLNIIVITVIVAMVYGCGWWKTQPMRSNTPEAIYQNGYEAYHKEKYKKAIESFQRVQEEYPLSKLAILAELGIADSHFSNEEYGEAEIAYEDFMNLHPTNENLPYIMYQIGMCHYKQMSGIDRDQSETLKTKEAFENLMTRYPSSKFSFMGEKRLRDCKKRLGEHELYIGHFYFVQEKYKAALRRFETASREYANVGLDYRLGYLIEETKKRIAEEEIKKQEK
jgi:outer membrane protein assembly factor BamD